MSLGSGMVLTPGTISIGIFKDYHVNTPINKTLNTSRIRSIVTSVILEGRNLNWA